MCGDAGSLAFWLQPNHEILWSFSQGDQWRYVRPSSLRIERDVDAPLEIRDGRGEPWAEFTEMRFEIRWESGDRDGLRFRATLRDLGDPVRPDRAWGEVQTYRRLTGLHVSGDGAAVAEFVRRHEGAMRCPVTVDATFRGLDPRRSGEMDRMRRMRPHIGAAGAAYVREREAAAAKAARVRAVAQEVARATLRSFLTAEQWHGYDKLGGFTFTVPSGNRYLLESNSIVGNIHLVDGEEHLAGWCAHPVMSDGLPIADAHLGQFLALKADEAGFIAKANMVYDWRRRPTIAATIRGARPGAVVVDEVHVWADAGAVRHQVDVDVSPARQALRQALEWTAELGPMQITRATAETMFGVDLGPDVAAAEVHPGP